MIERLRDCETDPGVQAVIVVVPAGTFLVSSAIIFGRKNTSRTPGTYCAPPAPYCHILI